ncbi:permease, partial [Staphylococcus cohnii]|uniref:metalloprotease family protein n=2 Tax=Staphylococcus TaxID=1279 RepID=UPI000D42119C
IYRVKYGLIKSHMPQVYFKKWQYSLIMLAPLIIISPILFIIFFITPYSSIIFITSFHIGYCVVDLYLLSGVLNEKVEVIEDTEDGIKYYTKNPSIELQTESKP